MDNVRISFFDKKKDVAVSVGIQIQIFLFLFTFISSMREKVQFV